jgi:hypothetical protein
MKIHKLLFIVLISSLSIAQKKKEIYLNDRLEEITKNEFQAPLKESDYLIKIDSDTIVSNVRIKRNTDGKLSSEELEYIKGRLETLSAVGISAFDRIVINYYPGADICNTTGDKSFVIEKYKAYVASIAKIANVKQFFIYKDFQGTQSYGKLKWYHDPNQVFEKTFFKLHYPCGSYVIIKPDGAYNSYKGEYDTNKILEKVKK